MVQEKQILHSKILGADKPGIPLLICHGIFGMLDNWQMLGAKFAEFFPVHLIDIRNHGRSFHSEEMSYSVMADDLKNYMDFLQIKKANLLGHSMGGKIVMEFALSFPLMCHKLVVADIAPKPYPPHHQSIIKALENIDFTSVQQRKDVDSQLEKYIPQNNIRQFLLKNVYRKENGTYDLKMNLPIIIKNYKNIIINYDLQGEFLGKTLFLKGGQSDYILPEDITLIKKHFPNSEVEIIEHASHWLHADQPQAFFEAVFQFLI